MCDSIEIERNRMGRTSLTTTPPVSSSSLVFNIFISKCNVTLWGWGFAGPKLTTTSFLFQPLCHINVLARRVDGQGLLRISVIWSVGISCALNWSNYMVRKDTCKILISSYFAANWSGNTVQCDYNRPGNPVINLKWPRAEDGFITCPNLVAQESNCKTIPLYHPIWNIILFELFF